MLTPAGMIDRYRKAYKLNNLSQYFMHRDGLLHILSGYGRIIEFSTSQIDKRGNYNPLIDQSRNDIISITEGHFKFGQLSGFGRILDNVGEC